MWLKTFVVIMVLAVITFTYLPLRQDTSYEATEQNHLAIDMQQTVSLIVHRSEPEKRYRVVSQSLNFDEKSNLTTFTPFELTGHTGEQSLKGNSNSASLTQLEMNLVDQVVLQQSAEHKMPRRFYSDQLIIGLKTHQLNSPGAIRMVDEKQQIEADSLVGNYEEGWYEFTQHVKTQWQ